MKNCPKHFRFFKMEGLFRLLLVSVTVQPPGTEAVSSSLSGSTVRPARKHAARERRESVRQIKENLTDTLYGESARHLEIFKENLSPTC